MEPYFHPTTTNGRATTKLAVNFAFSEDLEKVSPIGDG